MPGAIWQYSVEPRSLLKSSFIIDFLSFLWKFEIITRVALTAAHCLQDGKTCKLLIEGEEPIEVMSGIFDLVLKYNAF